jgi:hypothetical protein
MSTPSSSALTTDLVAGLAVDLAAADAVDRLVVEIDAGTPLLKISEVLGAVFVAELEDDTDLFSVPARWVTPAGFVPTDSSDWYDDDALMGERGLIG